MNLATVQNPSGHHHMHQFIALHLLHAAFCFSNFGIFSASNIGSLEQQIIAFWKLEIVRRCDGSPSSLEVQKLTNPFFHPIRYLRPGCCYRALTECGGESGGARQELEVWRSWQLRRRKEWEKVFPFPEKHWYYVYIWDYIWEIWQDRWYD